MRTSDLASGGASGGSCDADIHVLYECRRCGAVFRNQVAAASHHPAVGGRVLFGPASGSGVVLTNDHGDVVKLRVGERFDPAGWEDGEWWIKEVSSDSSR